MIKKLAFILLSFSLLYSSCRPYVEEQLSDINIDLKDPTIQRIYEFQDRQQTDSLYFYLHHSDPIYRYVTAMAFGSIKTPDAIDSLGALLSDPMDIIRATAAYSLGQIGNDRAEPFLIEAFESYDTAGIFKRSNRAILEAIGKCSGEDQLNALSSISTYLPKDTFLLEGQAWGIYRFALRDITTSAGTQRMIDLAGNKEMPNSVRFIASNYLNRAKNIAVDSVAAVPLINLIEEEADPRIRMTLAVALGKVKSKMALATLIRLFDQEPDYRVRCNILRAFSNFEYVDVQAKVIQALKDPNPHVAKVAAQYFLESGVSQDATFYWRAAKDSLPTDAQLLLYRAANRHLPYYYVEFRNAINAELRQRFRQSPSPYEKADALRALGEFGWNYRNIQREGFYAEHPAVRTAGLEALDQIGRIPNFRTFFGEGQRLVSRELARIFQRAIESDDPGMIALAAGALQNDARNYVQFLDSLTFMENALKKLQLPQEIETYNALQNTISFLRGETPSEPKKGEYNHPIDWNLLASMNIEPQAIIRTSQGNIRVKLLPKIAPGTVANFIQLAQQNYYDNKNFHRVVPNFVIQGGCSRGDGFGGLDYSIRSELPYLHYDSEGYLGMASAGNHTEGTQFFITHSPTPHLDGNYTIFGRVTDGMDVVHKIMIGDRIEDVAIQ